MKKFYGAITHVYRDGTASVHPTTCTQTTKPIDTAEKYPTVTFITNWYATEKTAQKAQKKRERTLEKYAEEISATCMWGR